MFKFYSEKGAKEMIEFNNPLTGQMFFFKASDSNRYKLIDIVSHKSGYNNGYYVVFVSEKDHYCQSFDFNKLNNSICKIDFEQIEVI
ncbi:MAG: hypothetical protein ABIJ97_16595 [Bacteroidota bacterium]